MKDFRSEAAIRNAIEANKSAAGFEVGNGRLVAEHRQTVLMEIPRLVLAHEVRITEPLLETTHE